MSSIHPWPRAEAWWRMRRHRRRFLPQMLITDKNGKIVSMNIQLANDEVVKYGIHTVDPAGDIVPAKPGDTFTVTSLAPTLLGAILGALADGTPAVVLNALVKTSAGVGFTVTDAAGLPALNAFVDIVADLSPSAIVLDQVAVEITSQPVPTADAPPAGDATLVAGTTAATANLNPAPGAPVVTQQEPAAGQTQPSSADGTAAALPATPVAIAQPAVPSAGTAPVTQS